MKTPITTIILAFFVSASAMAQPRLMPESRPVFSIETASAIHSNQAGFGLNIGTVIPFAEGIGLQFNLPLAGIGQPATLIEDGTMLYLHAGNPYIGVVSEQNGLSMRVGAFVGGLLGGSSLARAEGMWLNAPYAVECYRGNNTAIKATARYRNPAWEVSPLVEAGFTSTLHRPHGRVVSEGITANYGVGIRSDAYGIEAEAAVYGWTALPSDGLSNQTMHYASLRLCFTVGRFVPTIALTTDIDAFRPATAVLGFRYRF
jgi:hypothetical protein